jgi:hypothetical protein
MPCKCKERRAKLLAFREKRRKKGRHVQAAALGAVLAVTDTVAKVVGIDNGEVESEVQAADAGDGGSRPVNP